MLAKTTLSNTDPYYPKKKALNRFRAERMPKNVRRALDRSISFRDVPPTNKPG